METSKCIILTGCKSVTLYDDNICRIEDMGCNFYLKHEHIGKTTRSAAVAEELQALNPYTPVNIHKGPLSDKDIQQFGAVIVCDTLPRKELFRINHACRTHKVPPFFTLLRASPKPKQKIQKNRRISLSSSLQPMEYPLTSSATLEKNMKWSTKMGNPPKC